MMISLLTRPDISWFSAPSSDVVTLLMPCFKARSSAKASAAARPKKARRRMTPAAQPGRGAALSGAAWPGGLPSDPGSSVFTNQQKRRFDTLLIDGAGFRPEPLRTGNK